MFSKALFSVEDIQEEIKKKKEECVDFNTKLLRVEQSSEELSNSPLLSFPSKIEIYPIIYPVITMERDWGQTKTIYLSPLFPIFGPCTFR